MIRYLFFFFLILAGPELLAQSDTEFWFAVPEITNQHADRPIYLRISTYDEPASVTIEFDGNIFGESVKAFSTVSIDLTDYIDELEDNPADSVLNYGLHITSNNEITAYYEVLGISSQGMAANCDIFTLKGKNALGTLFFIPLQNYWDNHDFIDAWSSFDIIATEDNTSITITPTQDLYSLHAANHPKGIPYTVVLNKRQTYSARALSNLGPLHPSGSKVTSDKPIAVTIKDDSMFDPSSWDLAGDQLVPVKFTGTEYIVVKASDSTNTDMVFICATQDATDVFIDGNATPVATLQTGEVFRYQLLTNQKYLDIKSSLPVYVNHICGFERELGGAVLPPLVCSGSRRVSFARPNNDPLAINIVVKAGKESYFMLNGKNNIITASAFSTVPGTGGIWVAAQIFLNTSTVPSGSIASITNDSADFQLSMISGNENWTFRYGYFSDFAGLELGPDKVVCKGDSLMLNAGFGKTSYLWSTGQTDQKIYVKDSAEYSVTINKAGCVLTDSIHVGFNPPVGKIFSYHDTSNCANIPVTLQTDTIFNSYHWNNGGKSRSIKPTTSGKYWVEVTNNYGCKKSDTITYTSFPLPHPTITYSGELETICWQELIVLTANSGSYKYLWNTGDTTQETTTPHRPEYKLIITDSNNCTDSTSLTIDCSTFVQVYNLFTPDGNGINESFYVKGLQPNKWSLEIFNRWGEQVYYSKNYNNDFYADGLSGGTYFYELKHVDGKKSYKGWVQIQK